MLSILIDEELSAEILDPVDGCLREVAGALSGISIGTLGADESVPFGTTDGVICGSRRAVPVSERFSDALHRPKIIVLVAGVSLTRTRSLLRQRVDGIIDIEASPAMANALAILAVAAGRTHVIPEPHGIEMAERLSEPPRELSSEECEFLGLAATRSVESAGQLLGLSRRQAQRRFESICLDLRIPNNRQAVIAAVRWGLVR